MTLSSQSSNGEHASSRTKTRTQRTNTVAQLPDSNNHQHQSSSTRPSKSRTNQSSAAAAPLQHSNTLEEASIQLKKDQATASEQTKDKDKECLYNAERVIGNGSFGVVYQATAKRTGQTVAIKKVLQDRRYKNRELAIMKMVQHPNVVDVCDCFYSRGEKRGEVYLNLVMEYLPETVYQTVRNHTRAKQFIPPLSVKLYVYQMLRSLWYIHQLGICHRDIKPQNLLLDAHSQVVKLCDFGSAKLLVAGEPNVAYICSRYYRAPELIFESTTYSNALDVWSMGCVMAELMMGQPLFQGSSGVDQLVEIIKVLGSPSKQQILAMNPRYTQFKFPAVKPHPWKKIFPRKPAATDKALDLLSKMLCYDPDKRLTPHMALCHPYFDELRDADGPVSQLPEARSPPLFNFTNDEIAMAKRDGFFDQLVPADQLDQYRDVESFAPNQRFQRSDPLNQQGTTQID